MGRDREDGKAPRVLVVGQSENMTRVAAAIGTGALLMPSAASLHDVPGGDLRAAVRNFVRDLIDLGEDSLAPVLRPMPPLVPTGTLAEFAGTIVGPKLPPASEKLVGVARPREIDPKALAERRSAAKRAKRARRKSRRKGR